MRCDVDLDPYLRTRGGCESARQRVALFVPSLRGGGAERVVTLLSQSVVARGVGVDVLAAQLEGPYLEQLPPQARKIDLRAPRVLRSLPRLIRYLRRRRPTGMLVALDHANLVAILARRLARVPTRLVVSVHAPLGISSKHSRVQRAKFIPLLARWLYPAADWIVAVSHGIAEELVATYRLPEQRIRVIYNPVVSPELLRKAAEPVLHPWFQEGAPPVIVSAGRLTPEKDFPVLLRAFARVRQSTRARLVILGEGEERARLELLAQELRLQQDVALLGFVPNPYAYFRCAAVFALASRWEGFGNALVEALACGTPVVATDCPSGPREILGDGRWGILVPVGDHEALANAILQTLEQPPERTALQQRAQEFTVERATEAYLSLLLGTC